MHASPLCRLTERTVPAVLLPFEKPFPHWLRIWALFIATPLPYLLILSGNELPGHLALTGYTVVLLLMAGYSVFSRNSGRLNSGPVTPQLADRCNLLPVHDGPTPQ